MPSKTKSNISRMSRNAVSTRRYRANLRESFSNLLKPEDCTPLSDEALQKEREINDAIFAEILTKGKDRLSKKPIIQPQPKLRMQPPRNKRSTFCYKSDTSCLKYEDYTKFVEPPSLLRPIKSRPSNILIKEDKKSLRAELRVERQKRAALRAEKKELTKLECDALLQSLPGASQPQENELKDVLVQEPFLMVLVKAEPNL